MMRTITFVRPVVRAKVGDILDVRTDFVTGKFVILPIKEEKYIHCENCALDDACMYSLMGFECPDEGYPEIMEDLI